VIDPAPLPPPAPDRVVRYVCGMCGYDETDWWSVHQAHYEAHLERIEATGHT
jgi:hypothetical protein